VSDVKYLKNRHSFRRNWVTPGGYLLKKYGRVRCNNIFADYGFCVFHLWKSIFNQPKFGTTQWNTPGYKGMPLWRSVFTWKQKIEWHLRFWPNYWKMKVYYEVYSFELNWLIIHLRNYEAFFCFMLIFTKELWNLVSYLTFKNRKYCTHKINILWQKINLNFKVTLSYTYFSWEFLT
jgi:hypothetical protein